MMHTNPPVATTDLPDGYRLTELGPLPAEWRVVRLGRVVDLRKGTIAPTEDPSARYVGLEHIDSGEIRIRRFGYAAETKSAKAVFQNKGIFFMGSCALIWIKQHWQNGMEYAQPISLF